MHIGSYDKMQAFVNEYLAPNDKIVTRILDLGSYDVNGTYRDLFNVTNWIYTGADLTAGPNVSLVLKNPYRWDEIASSSYDVVISGSLLEHVEYPWMTMIEVARVMRPGAITCHIAPAAGFEHRFPVDCYRYYPDGFHALCKWAGLIPIKVYTDWNTESSQDGGHVWKDSVMIAKKPEFSNGRIYQMNTILTMMNGVIT
jgi:SAM-dependent methyltransferase